MNRADRKRQEREQKKLSKVQNLTNEQLMRKENRIRDEASMTAKKVFMALMLTSLNANYKFGKKRLRRVIDDMNGQLTAVRDGYLQPAEILDLAISLKVDNWLDD